MFEIKIPVPTKIELMLARLFGEKFQASCMDSFISGYKWKGKTYITKQWIENQKSGGK